MSVPEFEGASFRDPRARVFRVDGRILRGLDDTAYTHWNRLRETELYRRFTEDGLVIATRELDAASVPGGIPGSWAGVLEHEPVPFVSYVYEWPFSMLRDAALSHLQLLEAALAEGMILKDSTPYNFQWRGARPVFIDIPSFETLAPGAPWAGYRQFCELFLNPLMLQRYKNVPFQPWLRGSLEGIRPVEIRALMSARDWLRPGVLKHVVLHAAAETRFTDTKLNIKSEMKDAGFSTELIRANVRGLRRVVEKLGLPAGKSEWTDYDTMTHYDDSDRRDKQEFVRRAVSARPRELVWDLGCNVGVYSRIAAEHSRYVVAMDADRPTVERLYRELRSEGNETIHPLTIDLVDPSPDRGWRHAERRTLEARGRPDLILCLALIHHVVLGRNVPLRDFLDWLADSGADVVVEFVAKDDPMARKLLRNKDDDYVDYTPETFARWFEERFEVASRLDLGSGTRTLYFGRARRAS